MKKIGRVLLFIYLIIAVLTGLIHLLLNDRNIFMFGNYSLVSVGNDNKELNVKKSDLLIVKNTVFTALKNRYDIIYMNNLNNVNVGTIQEIGRFSSTQVSLIVKDYNNNFIELNEGNYIGKWTTVKVPGVGLLYKFLVSTLGFIICFIIPILITIFYLIIASMNNINKEDKNKKDNNKKSLDVSEELEVI